MINMKKVKKNKPFKVKGHIRRMASGKPVKVRAFKRKKPRFKRTNRKPRAGPIVKLRTFQDPDTGRIIFTKRVR